MFVDGVDLSEVLDAHRTNVDGVVDVEYLNNREHLEKVELAVVDPGARAGRCLLLFVFFYNAKVSTNGAKSESGGRTLSCTSCLVPAIFHNAQREFRPRLVPCFFAVLVVGLNDVLKELFLGN